MYLSSYLKGGDYMDMDTAVSKGYIPLCGIAYCSDSATYQVEIQGFFKQYMCDKHTDLMSKAVHPSYWYGRELLSK